MNPVDAHELLDRAAVSVTPAESDPAARMVSLGRRSLRRRAWAAVGSAAAVLAAAVAVPLAITVPDRVDESGATVSFHGLSVVVPKGWQTSRVDMFNPCTAGPRTVYLAETWDLGFGARPSSGPAKGTTVACTPPDQAWLAVVHVGVSLLVNPTQLVVKDGQPLQIEQPDPSTFPSMWAYRTIAEFQAPTAFISGDEKSREQLLNRVSWPVGRPVPLGGGLALPDRITSATTDVPPNNHMVVTTDARTLNQIRAKLAEQREPVPPGEECTLKKPGSLGISLGEVIVVLGDASCPQAISTGGGRVQVPAGLGQELLDLIVAGQQD